MNVLTNCSHSQNIPLLIDLLDHSTSIGIQHSLAKQTIVYILAHHLLVLLL